MTNRHISSSSFKVDHDTITDYKFKCSGDFCRECKCCKEICYFCKSLYCTTNKHSCSKHEYRHKYKTICSKRKLGKCYICNVSGYKLYGDDEASSESSDYDSDENNKYTCSSEGDSESDNSNTLKCVSCIGKNMIQECSSCEKYVCFDDYDSWKPCGNKCECGVFVCGQCCTKVCGDPVCSSCYDNDNFY